MKHTMIICDSDREYAYKAAGYINNREGFPFEVRVCEDISLLDENKDQNIDILLINEKLSNKVSKGFLYTNMLLLSEDSLMVNSNERVIYKYQSIEGIIKELLLYAATVDNLKNLINRKNQMSLIGMFSPIGRSGQTSLGLSLGQSLAKKHRTLYVNLDCYGGITADLLNTPCSGDLSDLLYSVNNDSKDIATLIGGSCGEINGLDIMPSMARHNDLISITYPEWRNFLRHIEDNTDYEFVILDMSKAIQGLTELLVLCHILIVTVTEDSVYKDRLDIFKNELEGIDDTADNIKYIKIPYMKQGMTYFGYMSEIGEYAKELVGEIVG